MIQWYFGRIWAQGTWINSGPGPKTEEPDFPVLGVPQGRKTKVSTGMVVRTFLASYVGTDRTPTGGKSQKTRTFGDGGLGWPWALGDIPGPGRKWKIELSRCQGARDERKVLPRYPGVVVFKKLTLHVLADRTLTGRQSQNVG